MQEPPADDPTVVPLNTWPQPTGHSAPCGLMLLTADGFVLEANRTAELWFGDTGTELRPLASYLGIWQEEQARQVAAFLDALRRTGQALPLELNLARRTGQHFTGEISANPLRGPDGTYLGCDLLLLDETQRRRYEGSVAALQQRELEHRLSERSRLLAAAQRDLDVFSQLVSHDLRAPLRHLGGYMGLMRERIEPLRDEVLLDYHAAMQKSLSRISQMVEALLEFSRLALVQMDVKAVPLAPLVQGVVARLRHARPDRAIDWRIAPDLPAVQGDAMLLALVFDHLFDNAMKFSATVEHPVIEVAWEAGDSGLHRFVVRDNGVGFDRAKAVNLFVMFQRQHHSMDYPGLGTGLAMTQRIIERHGGQIRCDSSPGAGCEVHFTLPAAAG